MNWGILLPTVSTIFIVLSAICVAIGWVLIIQRKRDQHKKVMLTAAWLAVCFFIVYISKTVFIGNTPFNGPDNVAIYYVIYLLFHITLSTSSAVLGVITIVAGLKGNFFRHKRLGRITAVCWIITAITGVAVYYLLYIRYPVAETTGLFDAIFN